MMMLYVNRADVIDTYYATRLKNGDLYKDSMDVLKNMIADAVGGTFNKDEFDRIEQPSRAYESLIVSFEAEGAFTLVVSNFDDDDRCHRRYLEAEDNHLFATYYFHPRLQGGFYDTRLLAKVYYDGGMVNLNLPKPSDIINNMSLVEPTQEEREMVEKYAIENQCTAHEAYLKISEMNSKILLSDCLNTDSIMQSLIYYFHRDWD